MKLHFSSFEFQNKYRFLIFIVIISLLNFHYPLGTANTTTKFANISDVEQTSNDSNDVQNSNFYIQNKVSNLTKKKVEQKDRTEDSNDAVGGMSSNISKPEGARSPAYSDISDDSNIATDNGMNGKIQFATSSTILILIQLYSLFLKQ
jgi:hypothetical protein